MLGAARQRGRVRDELAAMAEQALSRGLIAQVTSDAPQGYMATHGLEYISVASGAALINTRADRGDLKGADAVATANPI